MVGKEKEIHETQPEQNTQTHDQTAHGGKDLHRPIR